MAPIQIFLASLEFETDVKIVRDQQPDRLERLHLALFSVYFCHMVFLCHAFPSCVERKTNLFFFHMLLPTKSKKVNSSMFKEVAPNNNNEPILSSVLF